MGITVIEQTTAERQKETEELYEQVKPYLDKGLPIYKAVPQALHINHMGFHQQRWYKDLLDYAVKQGYQKRR